MVERQQTVSVDGAVLPLTESGFLRRRADWTVSVAQVLAQRAGIELSEAHWEIIHFIRDYYARYNHLPNARLFTQAVRKQLGAEKGNSRYLYRLFPDGPVKYACQIAGLAKPPGCV